MRRNLGKIEEAPGLTWLQGHLDYSVAPLLDEPWVLDVDTTIKPLYGEQEGAELDYNPRKPGRPSHCYHTCMLSNLRLLSVDVQPGDQHNVEHATDGLWSLLDRWDRSRWPRLLRGDLAWGIEPVMAEHRNLAYLFRLRTTKNVSRALQRAMAQFDWSEAGQGWQGNETSLRLEGWSRQRRVILLRRQLKPPLAIVGSRRPRSAAARLCREPALAKAGVGPDRQVWEYAALVTSLDSEILTLGQLYRDRADCENTFDELNAANPSCRPGQADGQQRARRATSGTPRLSADRRLHGPTAAKCGAVGRARAVVSPPQRSAATLSAWPAARTAHSPQPQSPVVYPTVAQRTAQPTAGFRIKAQPAAIGVGLLIGDDAGLASVIPAQPTDERSQSATWVKLHGM